MTRLTIVAALGAALVACESAADPSTSPGAGFSAAAPASTRVIA